MKYNRSVSFKCFTWRIFKIYAHAVINCRVNQQKTSHNLFFSSFFLLLPAKAKNEAMLIIHVFNEIAYNANAQIYSLLTSKYTKHYKSLPLHSSLARILYYARERERERVKLRPEIVLTLKFIHLEITVDIASKKIQLFLC